MPTFGPHCFHRFHRFLFVALLPLAILTTLPALCAELLIHVQPATAPGDPNRLPLREGFIRARAALSQGTPVRLVLSGGIYRESVAELRLDTDTTMRETPLIIEAAPDSVVIWSGADLIPPAAWRDEGEGLLSAAWPHTFGHFAYPWGVSGFIGHRREMAWIDGAPLRPVVLENYTVAGLASFGSSQVTWEYVGLSDPRTTLTPGTFGVTELPQNGRRIYLRLPSGATLPSEGVEVAVRARLLTLSGKHHVTLRDITFEKCANSERDFGADAPISIGPSPEDLPRHVTIDRCRFRWNSGTGFNLRSGPWTILDSDFSYNGFSGLTTNDAADLRFERVTANFNAWREYLAGTEDWNYGGMKMHGTRRQLLRGVTAIGNATHGLWWDVHCHDITLEDAVLIGNRRSLIFELGSGPFVARRVLAANGFRRAKGENEFNPASVIANAGGARIDDSVFYTDDAPEVLGFLWYERQDEHARREPLQAGRYELHRSVVIGGPRVNYLVREANVGDRALPSYRSFSYAGFDNTFFHLGGRTEVFAYQNLNYTVIAQGLAPWSADRETRAQWSDPGLRDPANYDFRFASDSPLLSANPALPQYALPPALRQEQERFHAWLGWPSPRP